MTDNVPAITEDMIEKGCSAQSFERGYNYYRRTVIFDTIWQGDEIRAYCKGSGSEPYQVSATITLDGIGQTYCTCLYDWGGYCKHIVALLLTWVNKQSKFQKMDMLPDLLAKRSKEDLILLIQEMIKRNPDLIHLVELPIQPNHQTPLELDKFRHQINYAIDRYEDDYHGAQQIATELVTITDIADRFLKAADLTNAGALYHLILEEITPQYMNLYDENGDLSLVLQDCTAGLKTCFETGSLPDNARQTWLNTLFELYLVDIDLGGSDLAYLADEIIIEHATPEEWAPIEQKLRQIIATKTGKFDGWNRESFIGFLTSRLTKDNQTETAEALIFELGTPRQKAFLLVEQGHFNEAIALAQGQFDNLPGVVTRFADALVAAGASELAEEYISQLTHVARGNYYLMWLAEHAQKQGQLNIALDRWKIYFEAQPTLNTYQKLQQLAEELEQWPDLRQKLIKFLEKNSKTTLLLEIALNENQVEWALKLLSKMSGWDYGSYSLRVAKIAETDSPNAALNIYQKNINQLIEARGRDNYAQAAQLLLSVRRIYQQQDEAEIWQAYLSNLRNQNSNLPALQDELNKAGL